MVNEEDSYVTINPAVAYLKFNVVIMRWDHYEGMHIVFRISDALPRVAADALANSWAAASKLEVR